ncbi:MAG: DUF2927 domain-containing protein [Rhodospirillales bacterium]|jgi:hypothetical protein|nr:DUF2927 domain-containing protein [Rhodospirillales bacterium]
MKSRFGLARSAVSLVATALLLVSASAAEAKTYSVNELVDYFDAIVFGAELDPKYAARMISKWQGPVGISIQGRVSKELAGFAQTHLKAISKISRLKFQQVDPTSNVQSISLIFVKSAEMAKIPVPAEYLSVMKKAAVNANCYFLSWKKPESRIVKAIIVVDAEKDSAVLNSCILEELTQSLGLPNDSNTLRPSIFSDRDRLFELGPQDKLLLHMLYHPDMKPGYTRAQARKAARAIVTKMAKRKKKPAK